MEPIETDYYHKCECLVTGCVCTNEILCTPKDDWCADCDEGIHNIRQIVDDGVLDMSYRELELAPFFDDVQDDDYDV